MGVSQGSGGTLATAREARAFPCSPLPHAAIKESRPSRKPRPLRWSRMTSRPPAFAYVANHQGLVRRRDVRGTHGRQGQPARRDFARIDVDEALPAHFRPMFSLAAAAAWRDWGGLQNQGESGSNRRPSRSTANVAFPAPPVVAANLPPSIDSLFPPTCCLTRVNDSLIL